MKSLPRFAWLSIWSALAVTAAPGVARAMLPFPGEIQDHLHLSYAPPCSICHAGPQGGGPVVQPFGLAMVANGLGPAGTGSIPDALDALAAQKIDSDCQSPDDVEQLEQGRNPSAPGQYIDGSGETAPADPGCTAGGGGDVPIYGCDPRGQIAAVSAPALGSAALPALMGLVFVRRRRGARGGRPRGAPPASRG